MQSGISVGSPGISPRDAGRLAGVLEAKVTQRGVNLASLSLFGPVLVVFLRHSGCTFCRESLADIARGRAAIEANGTRIVIVHMASSKNTAQGGLAPFPRDREFPPGPETHLAGRCSSGGMLALLAKHGLDDLDRIEDDDQSLYRAFGLRRGTFRQLFGPKVWFRGLMAGAVAGHGMGRPDGDIRQMPGAFVINRCEVVQRFKSSSAADRLPVMEFGGAS